jgi:hypothetical protein
MVLVGRAAVPMAMRVNDPFHNVLTCTIIGDTNR